MRLFFDDVKLYILFDIILTSTFYLQLDLPTVEPETVLNLKNTIKILHKEYIKLKMDSQERFSDMQHHLKQVSLLYFVLVDKSFQFNKVGIHAYELFTIVLQLCNHQHIVFVNRHTKSSDVVQKKKKW